MRGFYSGAFIPPRCPSFCFHEFSHATLCHWCLARQSLDRVSYWIYLLRITVCQHLFAWKICCSSTSICCNQGCGTSCNRVSKKPQNSWATQLRQYGRLTLSCMFNCLLGMPSRAVKSLANVWQNNQESRRHWTSLKGLTPYRWTDASVTGVGKMWEGSVCCQAIDIYWPIQQF